MSLLLNPLVWLIALSLPFIFSAATLYPAFALWRFATIRRSGALEDAQRRAWRWFRDGVVGLGGIFAALLVVAMGGLLRPVVSSPGGALDGVLSLLEGSPSEALLRFVERGGLALFVPLLMVDGLLAMVLSPERALRAHRRRGGGA